MRTASNEFNALAEEATNYYHAKLVLDEGYTLESPLNTDYAIDYSDTVGLSVDFENKTFERLAGAIDKTAGADFNQFAMYGGRKRCNVADDGTITSYYGDADFKEDGYNTANQWRVGSYKPTGEYLSTETDFVCSLNYIECSEGDVISISYPDVANFFAINFYNDSKSLVSRSSNWSTYSSYQVTAPSGAKYFTITFKDNDGATVDSYNQLSRSITISINNVPCKDEGQVMVYQPKFYYSVVPVKYDQQSISTGYNLRKVNYYISESPHDGFKLHPAFYDKNGNEIDYVLVGAYEGCVYDTSASTYITDDAQVADFTVSTGDKFSSIANVKPASGRTQNLTRANLEKLAQNRGTNWHGDTIQIVSMNQLLCMIEMGAMDFQSAIGQGVVGYASDSGNESSNTGSTSSLGNGTGQATQTIHISSGGITTTGTTSGKLSVSYRGLENPWGNMVEFIDGINIWGNGSMSGGQAYICNDLNFIESKKSDNYEATDFNLANTTGCISSIGYAPKCDWCFLPSENSNSNNQLIGDYSSTESNLNNKYYIAVGSGSWSYNSLAGGFHWSLNNPPTEHGRAKGGRLVYIPTAPSTASILNNDTDTESGIELSQNVTDVKYLSNFCSDSGLGIGGATSSSLTFKWHEKEIIPKGAKLTFKLGLEKENSEIEYVSVGKFIVSTSEKEGTCTTYTAYDEMIKTDIDYKSELVYPTTASNIIDEISTICDVEFNELSSDVANIVINTKPVNYTCRSMLSIIAQLACKNVMCDSDGHIEFKWLNSTDFVADKIYIDDIKIGATLFNIDKITCVTGTDVDGAEKGITSGLGNNGIVITNEYMTQDVLNNVYNTISNTSYYDTEISMLGDIRLQAGDIIDCEIYRDKVFDNKWVYGVHNLTDGILTSNDNRFVSNKNKIKCSAGDSITINYYSAQVYSIRVYFYDSEMQFLSTHANSTTLYDSTTNKSYYTITAPNNAQYFNVTIADNNGVEINTNEGLEKDVEILINNSLYLKETYTVPVLQIEHIWDGGLKTIITSNARITEEEAVKDISENESVSDEGIIATNEGQKIISLNSNEVSTLGFTVYGHSMRQMTNYENKPTANDRYPIHYTGENGYFDCVWRKGGYIGGGSTFSNDSSYRSTTTPISCDPTDNIVLHYNTKYSTLSPLVVAFTYYDENLEYVGGTWDRMIETTQLTASNIPSTTKFFHVTISRYSVGYEGAGHDIDYIVSHSESVKLLINNKYACIVDIRGRNLFDINGDINSTTNGTVATTSLNTISNDALVVNTSTYCRGQFIYGLKRLGVRIIISGEVVSAGNSSSIRISEEQSSSSTDFDTETYEGRKFSFAYTPTSDVTFIGFLGVATYRNIQVEIGEASTDYVEFYHNRLYLPIDSPLKSVPVFGNDGDCSHWINECNLIVNKIPYIADTLEFDTMGRVTVTRRVREVKLEDIDDWHYSNGNAFSTTSGLLDAWKQDEEYGYIGGIMSDFINWEDWTERNDMPLFLDSEYFSSEKIALDPSDRLTLYNVDSWSGISTPINATAVENYFNFNPAKILYAIKQDAYETTSYKFSDPLELDINNVTLNTANDIYNTTGIPYETSIMGFMSDDERNRPKLTVNRNQSFKATLYTPSKAKSSVDYGKISADTYVLSKDIDTGSEQISAITTRKIRSGNTFGEVLEITDENKESEADSWVEFDTDYVNFEKTRAIELPFNKVQNDFESGFSEYSGATLNVLYTRTYPTMVTIQGAITNSSIESDTSGNIVDVMQLPSALYPPTELIFVCQGSGINRFIARITTDGMLGIGRYGTTSYTQIPAGSWLNLNIAYMTNFTSMSTNNTSAHEFSRGGTDE